MVAVPKDAADDVDDEPVVAEPEPDDVDDGLIARDVEPDDSDGAESGDTIDLVRTGLIRVTLGGTRYRLRRPFFGEFKKLRLAIEDANDEISTAVDEQMRVSRQNVIEADEHKDDDPDAYVEWRADVRKRSSVSARALTDLAETRRYEWWVEMWTLLTLDGAPDDFPAWVTDPNIANTLLGHWRSSPSGRG
jgi:hypothetical protein